MGHILELLKHEKPVFHGGSVNPTSWNSNLNFLGWLETILVPGWKTLEVGSGYSTIVFLGCGCTHVSITPDAVEIERILGFCQEHKVAVKAHDTRVGDSAKILPTMMGESFDFIFIDGAHRFPYPMVDWHYCRNVLKQEGLLAIDDTDIISCNILMKFMESDPFWERVEVWQNYAVYRKLGDECGYDWNGQPFSMHKIIPQKTLAEKSRAALKKMVGR